MKYTGGLQSLHIKPDRLKDLDQLLRDDSTDPKVNYELETNEFTYEYSDPAKIWNDSLIQDFIFDFKVEMNCEEGSIRLGTYKFSNEGDRELSSSDEGIGLYIKSDDGDWTRSKKERIDSFFNTHGNRVRTLLSERRTEIALGGAVLIGLASNYMPQSRIEPVLAGFVSFFAIALLIYPVLRYFHPYALLVLDQDEKLRPNSHKAFLIIGGLVSIITLIDIVGIL